ncbi:MAG TPA: hypothetical protein VMC80_01440 [Patescibacteria group bacterium]|nr:hypothetical protein [Patescibacteria group bacterium]
MRAIGFSFKKINVEKLASNSLEDVKINANIEISEVFSVKPTDLLKPKDELLGVRFVYTLFYEPEFAKLAFSGEIIFEVDPKVSKDILKSWKDSKEMPEDFRMLVFNVILRKCNLKALEIEDDMNLPLHMPMPTVQPENKDKKSASN